MELLGVIATLRYFTTPISILIHSDSQYVVSSVNNGHVFEWIKNNDTSKKNLDLWKELVSLLKIHNVKLKWVKGHADDEMNQLADLYAQHASSVINPVTDKN